MIAFWVELREYWERLSMEVHHLICSESGIRSSEIQVLEQWGDEDVQLSYRDRLTGTGRRFSGQAL